MVVPIVNHTEFCYSDWLRTARLTVVYYVIFAA
jgi:hypothetical protein